jgi:hypothetical protein
MEVPWPSGTVARLRNTVTSTTTPHVTKAIARAQGTSRLCRALRQRSAYIRCQGCCRRHARGYKAARSAGRAGLAWLVQLSLMRTPSRPSGDSLRIERVEQRVPPSWGGDRRPGCGDLHDYYRDQGFVLCEFRDREPCLATCLWRCSSGAPARIRTTAPRCSAAASQ